MDFKYFVCLFSLYLTPTFLFSQQPNDCINAIPLSQNSGIAYNPKGPGINDFAPAGNFSPDCSFSESASIWLKIKIAKTGTLTMDLSPNNKLDDYDFAFYKPSKAPPDACSSLGKAVRCSSTNPQAAGVSAMTGMTDSEMDVSEGPAHLGNGYVKSLTVKKGEYYYILINNFSNKEGFSLTFGGTAKLDSSITCDLGSDISRKSCNRQFDLIEIIKGIKNGDSTLSVELFNTLSDAQNYITKNRMTGVNYTATSDSETLHARIVDSKGCVDFKTVRLINDPIKKIKDQPFHFCTSNPNPIVKLSGVPINHIIKWYDAPIGGSLLHTGNNYHVSKSNNIYYVSITENSTGCESRRAEIKTIIEPIPKVKIKTPYKHWFFGQKVRLSAIGDAVSYLWKGKKVENNTNKSVEFTASAQQRGTYILTGKQHSDCKNTDKVELKMYNPVKNELGEDFVVCFGETQTIAYPNITGFKYQWNTGEKTNAITISKADTYRLTVTTPDGNTDTGEVQVKQSDIRLNTVKNCFNQFIAAPTGGTPPYQYSLDGGLSWQDSPIFTKITSPSKHRITVRDINSCTRSTSYLFMPRFVLYQAFSPNKDNINDVWDLSQLSGCDLIDVKIFDRFGRYIHRMRANNLIWDGTVKGKLIPSGTYWFNINFNDGVTPRISKYIVIKRRKN